jgi:hypothetical protein
MIAVSFGAALVRRYRRTALTVLCQGFLLLNLWLR